MKTNWYISALIIALAILGISLERNAVPNQEIIIQFSDAETSLHQTQDAIALVKSQLELVAIDNINVEQLVDGKLKVTYYSDLEVADIKAIFSVALASKTANTKRPNDRDSNLPFQKEDQQYQLDVYNIQDVNDLGGAAGTTVTSKSETTRSQSVKIYSSLAKQYTQEKNISEKTTYTSYTTTAVFVDHSSHKIPETRAGPIT